MKKQSHSLLKDIKITLAIAWKDILDGWKNKIILTSIFTSLFLVIFYTYLPELTNGDELPRLVVLDQANIPNIENIENISEFKVYLVSETATFLEILRDLDVPGLGFILDSNFTESINSQNIITLQGYVPYWVKPSQISEVTIKAESLLSSYFNRNIEFDPSMQTVYPIMDSSATGKSFIAIAGLLIQITIMGLSMAPQLIVEEKEAKTLQAVIVSPANLSHFIFGKTLAVLFYTLLSTGIGLLFVHPLILDWGLAIPSLLIGMLAIIMPGIFLGVVLQSKQQISIWIWVLFVPTMIPLFLSIVRVLPKGLMAVVGWWPTVALFRLIKTGFTLDPPFASFWKEGLYMLVLSSTFILSTILIIRRKTLKGN